MNKKGPKLLTGGEPDITGNSSEVVEINRTLNDLLGIYELTHFNKYERNPEAWNLENNNLRVTKSKGLPKSVYTTFVLRPLKKALKA